MDAAVEVVNSEIITKHDYFWIIMFCLSQIIWIHSGFSPHWAQKSGSLQRGVILRKQSLVMWCHKQNEIQLLLFELGRGEFGSTPSRFCQFFLTLSLNCTGCWQLLVEKYDLYICFNWLTFSLFFSFLLGVIFLFSVTPPVIIWNVMKSWFVQDPKKEGNWH